MKVLHVLNELRPSGAEVMLWVATPYWQKMDIQAEILSTGEVPGSYAPILENVGYPIHHLPYSHSVSFLRAFYKLLQSGKYDIVHLHAERANFWLALLAQLAGIPRVVRTIHNVFPWKGIRGLERRIQRWILHKLGVLHVSIGSSVKATEWEYFRNPTVYVPNWYDSDKFIPPSADKRSQARTSFEIEEDTFVLVSVGNCSRIKNHTAILQALKSISERIKFLYIHIGQEEQGEPERKLSEELGIANCVRFLGFVEEILPILYAADVYLMPSLHEGFSIAAIEAMATGMPVVLADVPGLRDLKQVTDKVRWVEPEPDSIAQALLSLSNLLPKVRQQMGLNLHNSVYERFGVEQGVRKYVAIYRNQELGKYLQCN